MIVQFTEKERTAYYQNIVNHVCKTLDRIHGANVLPKIVCGTIEEPSEEVQNAIDTLVDHWNTWYAPKVY